MRCKKGQREVNGVCRPRPQRQPDLTNQIIAYESGDLSDEGTVALFQRLVDNGQAWQLQGSYGRQAQALIESGLVTPKQKVISKYGRRVELTKGKPSRYLG
jgi:hypothetical protein